MRRQSLKMASSTFHQPLRSLPAHCLMALLLGMLLVPCLVQAQFIHIFEVQDENRAPKSDLFDPSSYKYVSPAQLQKQQEANKILQAAASPTAKPTASPPTSRPQSAPVPEYRATPPVSITISANDARANEITLTRSHGRGDNAYTAHAEQASRHQHTTPAPTAPATSQPVTYMQPISRVLANISTNEIPAQSEMELRKQIRGLQQSENRYSRTTTPLRVSAQNHRQYVVRVPAPFGPNAGSPHLLPHEQLPPNLASQIQGSHFPPSHQAAAVSPVSPQSSPRLSTLNSVLNAAPHGADQGIPSSLLNSFLQRQQQPPPPQHQPQSHPVAQPPYATNIPASYVTPPAPQTVPLQLQTPTHGHTAPVSSSTTGRSVGSIAPPTQSVSLQSVLQPPVTNKESLTDEDIRLIEEHNRKVRLFLQQRQAELAQEQDRARQQKAAEEAAAKAQQEAAQRAAEHERIRRLRAEQEAAARQAAEQERIQRIRAEQEAQARAEAAARAAAEQDRIRRIKAEQEAAARAAAEAERLRRIREEQEAAQRQAAEQERIRRLRAEQEAAARAAAEQERARRIKAEQEAAARAAAEAERVRRIKAEQEAAQRAADEARIRRIQEEQEAAARAAAEQERIARYRAEQEAAARAASEAERIRRLRAEQEAIARAEAAARATAEQERLRRLKAEQDAAARAAAERQAAEQERVRRIKAEQDHLRRLREEQEAQARAAAEQEHLRKQYQEDNRRIQSLRAEQEAASSAAQEQERLRQLRAQQEAAARLAEAERERLTHLRAEQEIAAIRARYQSNSLPPSNLTSTSSLSYQPEPNLAIDDDRVRGQGQSEPVGPVDSARYRAEKEALAEQERLLRFQASQQALAQQQAAEQARLRRLREDEMLRAEEERAAREAQERQILRARHEQNRAIQAARDAALSEDLPRGSSGRLGTGRPGTGSSDYAPSSSTSGGSSSYAGSSGSSPYAADAGSSRYTNAYTDDISKYPAAGNYTGAASADSYGSLNNVRTPEPRSLRSSYRGPPAADQLPASEAIQPISGDYVRRVVARPNYANQTSSSSLSANRIAPEAPASTSRASTSSGHKPAKISLQELPPDLDADGIPGTAGRDYPTLTSIPKTSFSCARQPLNGYYADTETACQVVHMCQQGGVQDSFLCPNGTIWNQEKFSCAWWYEVSCSTAPSFYELNNKLYKSNELDDKQGSSPSSRQP